MDTIAGFAIRDAQPADAPALTQLVRSSGAYDGTYQVMVASQLIDPTYLARNPTRVCVDDQDAIVGFASLLVPGRGARARPSSISCSSPTTGKGAESAEP